MKVNLQVTDTFGGEANYAWKREKTIDVASHATDRSIVTQAKRAMGWTHKRCRVEKYGEMIALYPRHEYTVLVITWE